MKTIEFWFDFASTYSYLAVMRGPALADAHDVKIVWRPFLLGPLFHEFGWKTSPFNIHPDKGRHMWRDMERRCAARGLPFVRPSGFPQNSLLAARVGVAAESQPWLRRFIEEAMRQQFEKGKDISSPEVIKNALIVAGAEGPDDWVVAAAAPLAKQGLRERVAFAKRLGIFGAPSFVVRDELFWGDDRLDEAIDWALSDRGDQPGAQETTSDPLDIKFFPA